MLKIISYREINSATIFSVMEKIQNQIKYCGFKDILSEGCERLLESSTSLLSAEEISIELAKIFATQNGKSISRFINYFNISNQKALFEIAIIAAGQNGEAVSEYIKTFGLINQEDLIEVAKIAAAQNGLGTSKFIKNYDISNPEILIEIAIIATNQNGYEANTFIKRFNITNQKAIIDIVKIAAGQYGYRISKLINTFNITDQTALIEIAKIAAAQNGLGISKFIQSYGITDQSVLIEIAKIAAGQNGKESSRFINNYGITNQTALIEIAKIAATQNGGATSRFINNYEITDQTALIEIAKIAASQNGSESSKFIRKYSILNPKDLTEIFFISFLQDHNASEYYLNYQIELPLIEPLILAKTANKISQSIHLLPQSVQSFLSELKTPFHLMEAVRLYAIILGINKLYERTQDEDSTITLIQTILKIRESKLKFKLIIRYLEVLNEPDFQKIILEHKPEASQSAKEEFILKCIAMQGVPKILEPVVKIKVKSRDEKKKLLQELLFMRSYPQKEILADLIHTTIQYMSNQQKISTTVRILTLYRELQMMESTINESNLVSLETLRTKHEHVFKQRTGLINMLDFDAKFDNTIRKFRKPEALLTYATKVSTRSNCEKMLWNQFIESILNETFQVLHYLHNEHLDTLTANQIKIWKQGEIKQLVSINSKNIEGSIEDTDNPEDLLLLGTEVDGSCLRVDGDNVNRGLLGYIMDGKYRALVIKDCRGQIVARAMLRLMWDNQNQKPVLFMEQPYKRKNVGMDEAEEKLTDFAINRAKALDLMLVKVANEDEPDGLAVESLGGPAPYEYVDALRGLQPSKYIIPSTIVVWEPEG